MCIRDSNRINGATMDMSRVDQVVTVGARERWIVDNQHHLPHNLHIHNARFPVSYTHLDVYKRQPPWFP